MIGQKRENFLKYYDSVGELCNEMRDPKYRYTEYGENLPRAIAKAERGDTSMNARIDELVSKVSVELPSEQDQWVADVAGCAPIVPAAIAGLPDNMMRLEKIPTSGVPLRIFVSVGLSGGTNDEMCRNRGIAIVALLRHLSARRTTELWLYDDSGGLGYMVGPVVRVQSTPLDQAMLVGVLADPDFERALCFPFLTGNGQGRVGWAFGGSPAIPEIQRLTREALQANPDDLVIFGGHLDYGSQLMRDPMGWIADQIKLTEKTANGEG